MHSQQISGRVSWWSPGGVLMKQPVLDGDFLCVVPRPPRGQPPPCWSLDIQATSSTETWASLFPSVSVMKSGGGGVQSLKPLADYNRHPFTPPITSYTHHHPPAGSVSPERGLFLLSLWTSIMVNTAPRGEEQKERRGISIDTCNACRYMK